MVKTVDHSIEVTEAAVWEALENVKDPEIPVLSVVDLGIITGIKVQGLPSSIQVTMTPTFVGCPAIGVIKESIRGELLHLANQVEVQVDYETPWTSDRMSPQAKDKLEKFGLAPPISLGGRELTEEQLDSVRCPHCKSTDTTLRSSFGSTLCRAIRFCFNCKQGFEQFKPI